MTTFSTIHAGTDNRPQSAALGAPSPYGTESAQYLTFMLGSEMFAIGILAIKEIIEYSTLTSVPLMPAAVRGVINLRGAVVPVVDLSARFGNQPSGIGKRTCIVIVEISADGARQDVGVIVDAVNEVLDISGDVIEPVPDCGARQCLDFIDGMAAIDGRFVILLNVNRILASQELQLSADGTTARAEPPAILSGEIQ